MAVRIASFENRPEILNKRTLLIITGASRGLGRQLAVDFIPCIKPQSFVLLVSSNGPKLEETKSLVESSITKIHGQGAISVRTVAFDLSVIDAASAEKLFAIIPNDLDDEFEQLIFFHNAATMGDIGKKVTQLTDRSEVQEYWNLNVTSPVILNNIFLKRFPPSDARGILIVNVTSICAIQPMKTWSLYCSGKATRNMMFRVLALEEEKIQVLNYAPGPLNTNMQVEARTLTGDPDLKEVFVDMHANDQLLECHTTVRKLLQILDTNTFESGAHIDFFDVAFLDEDEPK